MFHRQEFKYVELPETILFWSDNNKWAMAMALQQFIYDASWLFNSNMTTYSIYVAFSHRIFSRKSFHLFSVYASKWSFTCSHFSQNGDVVVVVETAVPSNFNIYVTCIWLRNYYSNFKYAFVLLIPLFLWNSTGDVCVHSVPSIRRLIRVSRQLLCAFSQSIRIDSYE